MTNPDNKQSADTGNKMKSPDHYAKWAASYDADQQSSGYQAPEHAVRLLRKLVSPDARLIEFGCGTGLVGQLLAENNYRNVVGVDFSPEMLAQARTRNCYQSLREHDLTEPLNDDIRYDAALCVGVCSFGPLLAQHIMHLTSVLVDSAPLILTIDGRAWIEMQWAEQLDNAQEKAGISIEYLNTIPYLSNENIDAKLLVIRNSELDDREVEWSQETSE